MVSAQADNMTIITFMASIELLGHLADSYQVEKANFKNSLQAARSLEDAEGRGGEFGWS